MNTITLSQKPKNKHLNFHHYQFIIDQVNTFNASHKTKRNIGKTQFMSKLAASIGTSRSNLYAILKDAEVTICDTNLKEHVVLSAQAAFDKRSRKKTPSNRSKLKSAEPFIRIVTERIKANRLSSIDETINHLRLHESETIKGMTTVCTRTFYSYVHKHLIDIKPIDLPRMVRRRKPSSYKTYIPKRQKGTSIEMRPKEVETRDEFGHWEGDLVTGPRDGQNGAYLTLLERKSRFYLMLPIKRKSSKNVYMQINKLNKFYGEDFSKIFKSITFDNGNEFARWKDIEKKPGTKEKRTSVYFGRPYHSCDRASNENCNGLLRYFVKKGTNINTISKQQTIQINREINQKKRKILGYLPSETVFLDELSKLNVTHNTIFYER